MPSLPAFLPIAWQTGTGRRPDNGELIGTFVLGGLCGLVFLFFVDAFAREWITAPRPALPAQRRDPKQDEQLKKIVAELQKNFQPRWRLFP